MFNEYEVKLKLVDNATGKAVYTKKGEIFSTAKSIKEKFDRYKDRTGRSLHLEIKRTDGKGKELKKEIFLEDTRQTYDQVLESFSCSSKNVLIACTSKYIRDPWAFTPSKKDVGDTAKALKSTIAYYLASKGCNNEQYAITETITDNGHYNEVTFQVYPLGIKSKQWKPIKTEWDSKYSHFRSTQFKDLLLQVLADPKTTNPENFEPILKATSIIDKVYKLKGGVEFSTSNGKFVITNSNGEQVEFDKDSIIKLVDVIDSELEYHY